MGSLSSTTDYTSWLEANSTQKSGPTGVATSNKSLNYWCISLIVLPLLCISGNSIVIFVVIKERSLHTSTNFILISLACADLLVATLVMPFSIYLLANNMVWELPDFVCDFFCAADVSASTSSIVHLVAVSVDRFYAVVKHMEYNTSKHQSRITFIIGACWVFSLSVGLPLGIGLNGHSSALADGQGSEQFYCAIENTYFMLCSSIFAFYIPCVVMLIMYGVVFQKLRRSFLAVKLREMAATHMINFGNSMGLLMEGNEAQWAGPLLKTIEQDLQDCTVTDDFSDEEIEELKTVVEILRNESQIDVYSKKSAATKMVEQETGPSRKNRSMNNNNNNDKLWNSTISTTRRMVTWWNEVSKIPEVLFLRHRVSYVKARKTLMKNIRQRAVKVVMQLKSKERGQLKKEVRATKLVVTVMCAFLVCYLPFFTTNLVKIFKLWQNDWSDDWEHVLLVFAWLGYLNSCLNPLIYSVLNRKFRETSKKLFCGVRRKSSTKTLMSSKATAGKLLLPSTRKTTSEKSSSDRGQKYALVVKDKKQCIITDRAAIHIRKKMQTLKNDASLTTTGQFFTTSLELSQKSSTSLGGLAPKIISNASTTSRSGSSSSTDDSNLVGTMPKAANFVNKTMLCKENRLSISSHSVSNDLLYEQTTHSVEV